MTAPGLSTRQGAATPRVAPGPLPTFNPRRLHKTGFALPFILAFLPYAVFLGLLAFPLVLLNPSFLSDPLGLTFSLLTINGVVPYGVCGFFAIAGLISGLRYATNTNRYLSHVLGVQPLDKDAALARRVAALADRLGLPHPTVCTMRVANAYAIGSSPKSAAVVIGIPLLEKLRPEEVDAIIGHELGHIASGDMRQMQMAAGFQSVLEGTADIATRVGAETARRQNYGFAALIITLLGRALRYTIYLASTLLTMALSRRREFVADAFGALVTSPDVMANALRGLRDMPRKVTATDARYSCLMFFSPGGRWMATHPPMEKRIAALEGGKHLDKLLGRRYRRRGAAPVARHVVRPVEAPSRVMAESEVAARVENFARATVPTLRAAFVALLLLGGGYAAYCRLTAPTVDVASAPKPIFAAPDEATTTAAARGSALADDMMMAVVGRPSLSPQTQKYTNYNSFNDPVETIAISLTPRLTGPCALTIEATRDEEPLRYGNPVHLAASFVYDFTKMTDLSAAWTRDYEEGLLAALGRGPRPPRQYLEVKFQGADAACMSDKGPPECRDNFTPFYHIIDKSVEAEAMIAAFRRVQAACNPHSVPTPAIATPPPPTPASPPPSQATAVQAAPPPTPAVLAKPSPQQSPPAAIPFGRRTTTAIANVRAKPSRAAALAGTLKVGDSIVVDGISNDHTWVRINFAAGSGWVLARVLAKSTVASGNSATKSKPPVLAKCPDGILSVELEAEAGKYHPPALLAPTSDNGRTDNSFINFRAEWTSLTHQNVVLHCHLVDRVVDVALPPDADRCVRAKNRITCY